MTSDLNASNLFRPLYAICGNSGAANDVVKGSGRIIVNIGEAETLKDEVETAVKKVYELGIGDVTFNFVCDTSRLYANLVEKKGAKIEVLQLLNTHDSYIFNDDLACIPSVHPQAMRAWKNSSTPTKRKMFKKVTSELYENMWTKVFPKDFDKVYIQALEGVINERKTNSVSLPKGIAAVKNAYITRMAGSLKKHRVFLHTFNKFADTTDSVATVCYFGHWCKVSDLEGDHFFPKKEIDSRIEKLDYSTVPTHFKTEGADGKEILNQLGYSYLLFDSKNIIPLCHVHNSHFNMGFNEKISWLLGSELYGETFKSEYLVDDAGKIAIQDRGIIPRTKQGIGIGDAMMYHYLSNYNSYILSGAYNKMIGCKWLLPEFVAENSRAIATLLRSPPEKLLDTGGYLDSQRHELGCHISHLICFILYGDDNSAFKAVKNCINIKQENDKKIAANSTTTDGSKASHDSACVENKDLTSKKDDSEHIQTLTGKSTDKTDTDARNLSPELSKSTDQMNKGMSNMNLEEKED